MSSSPWKAYWDRSVAVLRQNSSRVLRAEADPSARSHLIYSLSRKDNPNLNLKDYATGCDSDIGGQSTAMLDFDEQGEARFWGELRRDVKGEYKGKVRGGYAGFRNKSVALRAVWNTRDSVFAKASARCCSESGRALALDYLGTALLLERGARCLSATNAVANQGWKDGDG
ncbi:hypothetical protein QFC21_002193 [Naganishia friedmannii]|uniref:Uncharacterized protein n=1 Tax=Naganishia friedmannii TaxID=89922 RepID=A0ACC2VWC9_9TREE|nr:hypothetical protein QFC21_002193 [Naganishia friedmannii]